MYLLRPISHLYLVHYPSSTYLILPPLRHLIPPHMIPYGPNTLHAAQSRCIFLNPRSTLRPCTAKLRTLLFLPPNVTRPFCFRPWPKPRPLLARRRHSKIPPSRLLLHLSHSPFRLIPTPSISFKPGTRLEDRDWEARSDFWALQTYFGTRAQLAGTLGSGPEQGTPCRH